MTESDARVLSANPRRSSAVDRRALSASLRSLREQSGHSLDEAASQALDASGAKLSRIETGKQVAGPRDVRDLCQLYGVNEERTAYLVSLATSAREPGWWESYGVDDDDYVGLEAGALWIQHFANSAVPALLQTRQYAESFLREVGNPGRLKAWTSGQIEEMLTIRETRQQVLKPGSGVRLSFLIDEAALRRTVGGVTVMDQQLKWLMKVVDHPHVDLQILPFSAGASPGQQGSFTILTLPGEAADAVYLDSLGGLIFLDSARELVRFRKLYDLIGNSCPPENETREILTRIADDTSAKT